MIELKNPSSQAHQRKVRLYDRPDSAAAYEIRDFLSRSVVEFDWVELTCDADCDRELKLPSLSHIRLPVVEFPDGTQIFAPTIREIAHHLGWVTQPKFKEYDLSIYGAGPAGRFSMPGCSMEQAQAKRRCVKVSTYLSSVAVTQRVKP
jgi:thioredoxin reductase (NADPH)